jgi:hypothetical protein
MEVTLPWLQIIIMTFVAWIGGALWFGPLFGKQWMKIIHDEHVPSPHEMDAMKKGMMALMVFELIATFLIMMTLAFLTEMLPGLSWMHVGFLVWIGFILPMIVSETLWGGIKKKHMLLKVTLSSAYRLLLLIIAGYLYRGW